MKQWMGDMLLGLFVSKTSSISPMHHKSKQRRQQVWDNWIAPSGKHQNRRKIKRECTGRIITLGYQNLLSPLGVSGSDIIIMIKCSMP